MTVSKDLFLSILSMDAYYRGYAPGIDYLGGFGTSIGSATIRADNLPSGSQLAGFYAIAYDDPTYGTIISYRGTDDFVGELFPVDLPISFAGSWQQEQILLAAQFFDAVDAANGSRSLLLTGDSLGSTGLQSYQATRRTTGLLARVICAPFFRRSMSGAELPCRWSDLPNPVAAAA